MDVDLSSPSSTNSECDLPDEAVVNPANKIASWPHRMKVAFSRFPLDDDVHGRQKFAQGFEWELVKYHVLFIQ
jgi:hypothetical protein